MASQEVMTGSLGQRQEKPANIFYHYTNMDGLLGIVGNAELWATDVRYLNDTSEFKFGTDMLREKMQEAVDRNGQASEALDRFELFVTQMRLPAYVTSFSAEPTGDDLSQWRAYGGAHSGFSLGFSRKYLTDVGTNFVAADGWARKGKNISIPFLACVYIDDENTSANHMVADRLLRNRSKEDPTDSAYLFAVNSARLKHKSFEGEKEWRMVLIRENDCPFDELEFRRSNSLVVPYVRIPLKWEGQSVKIERIVIGPTPHKKEARQSVEMLLKKHKVEYGEIADSSTPYRNW